MGLVIEMRDKTDYICRLSDTKNNSFDLPEMRMVRVTLEFFQTNHDLGTSRNEIVINRYRCTWRSRSSVGQILTANLRGIADIAGGIVGTMAQVLVKYRENCTSRNSIR